MIIADYHVHSEFSSDSQAPMEQVIEHAIQLGLKKLCFTDHMDFDYPEISEYRYVFPPNEYMKKLEVLKELYKKQIAIFTGIELGLQPHLANRLTAFTEQYTFDFVIGSSHVANHLDPYYPEYWKDRSVSDGLRMYFNSIIENCKTFQNFHIYGHLDYIIRYVPKQAGFKPDYSYEDYADLLDVVLKTLIYYGKGIELNTAGLKYGIGYPHPKVEILKRYLELGGDLITIGSDAHKPEHLCYDFHMVPDFLKNIGFQYYATFEGGKPVYEKL